MGAHKTRPTHPLPPTVRTVSAAHTRAGHGIAADTGACRTIEAAGAASPPTISLALSTRVFREVKAWDASVVSSFMLSCSVRVIPPMPPALGLNTFSVRGRLS